MSQTNKKKKGGFALSKCSRILEALTNNPISSITELKKETGLSEKDITHVIKKTHKEKFIETEDSDGIKQYSLA